MCASSLSSVDPLEIWGQWNRGRWELDRNMLFWLTFNTGRSRGSVITDKAAFTKCPNDWLNSVKWVKNTKQDKIDLKRISIVSHSLSPSEIPSSTSPFQADQWTLGAKCFHNVRVCIAFPKIDVLLWFQLHRLCRRQSLHFLSQLAAPMWPIAKETSFHQRVSHTSWFPSRH